MKFAISLLLICSFCTLLVSGLIRMLLDIARLDFDLPRDLHHSLGREIEPVHDFRGVAVQERK